MRRILWGLCGQYAAAWAVIFEDGTVICISPEDCNIFNTDAEDNRTVGIISGLQVLLPSSVEAEHLKGLSKKFTIGKLKSLFKKGVPFTDIRGAALGEFEDIGIFVSNDLKTKILGEDSLIACDFGDKTEEAVLPSQE